MTSIRSRPGTRRRGIALRILLGIALPLAGIVGWIAMQGDPAAPLQGLLALGERRELQPALFQTPPLRTAQGGADRAYLLSTQSETVIRVSRRGLSQLRREYLHIDLWAIDAATANLAWRKRLRTYEGREREGRNLPGFELLGADGATLWLNIDGPLGVSLDDGRVIADGASIDRKNPSLAGMRVDERGYVAFGRHGLQVTLNDASQWRIDAADLAAASRDTPVSHPEGIVPPASYTASATSAFQVRALPIGERWLGVLTDKEADHLSHRPVVPGREADERPGAMQQFLDANHVPPALNDPLPQPYRVWSARVKQVSAAPPGWPKELPDNWGTRPQFSDYEVLPEAPAFLRAGLLRMHRDVDTPLWYRDPDSVLVLHTDKLGEAGRLQLTRVSGPRGTIVWRAPLPFTSLESVMRGDADLLLWGREPPDPPNAAADVSMHQKLVRLDPASGKTVTLNLTEVSLGKDRVAPAVSTIPAG
jgi:hypothetical protein